MTARNGSLRCVTLNVLSPDNRGWDRRQPVIRDALRGLDAEREQQALRAALAVERHAAEGPAVVLGDFDATPDAASCCSGVVAVLCTGSVCATKTLGRRSTQPSRE